jgi:hypothetical protein
MSTILDSVVLLREFIEAEGRPADSLEELAAFIRRSNPAKERYPFGSVSLDGGTVNLENWVHYRKEANDEVVIFLCREEALSGFDGSERCSETQRPHDRDVYVRLSASGELMEASWERE